MTEYIKDEIVTDDVNCTGFNLSDVAYNRELSPSAKAFQEFCSDSSNSHNCAN